MSQESSEYEIVIIECCENCDIHKDLVKHSEWKYYEHFNQLKKKIERYVPNSIVIKNPIPDDLHQPSELYLEKNIYVNKNNQQKIIFPRIGSFEVYIYNILISSKLSSNTWPNHYKILQTLNSIVSAKKNKLSLDAFSVYNSQPPKDQTSLNKKYNPSINNEKISLQNNPRRKIISKKKKSNDKQQLANKFRVYKNKQPKVSIIDKSLQKNSILQPIQKDKEKVKKFSITNVPLSSEKQGSKRQIQSKQQNRIKLPSLRNTLTLLNSQQKKLPDSSLSIEEKKKTIFNSIDENFFDQDEMSIIEKDNETIRLLQTSDNDLLLKDKDVNLNRFDSLILENEESSPLSPQRNFKEQNKSKSLQQRYSIYYKNIFLNNMGPQNGLNELQSLENDFQDMKIVQNKSVQFSDCSMQMLKETMNRSIQYEPNQEQNHEFGIQIDDMSFPKQIAYQFVQTDKIEIGSLTTEQQKKSKPYMLDESIQAYIIVKKKEKHQQIQTFKPQIIDKSVNTDQKEFINKGLQFPDLNQLPNKKITQVQVDTEFVHLYEKRRNLPIDQHEIVYSVDKFEQKSTKYKWIGKAYEEVSFKTLKKKLLVEAMVFAVYNFFGIKTPQKRVAYLKCSNVLSDKISASSSELYHILWCQNPQIQYFSQFQDFNIRQKIFPLSEQITYKTSKQKIKFDNWGKFLALVYFLEDNSIFNHKSQNNNQKLFTINDNSNKLTQAKPQNQLKQFNSFMNKFQSSVGLVITNETVKQIFRMNCQQYQLFVPQILNHKDSQFERYEQLIFLTSTKSELFIDPKRLSKSVQLEFISMLNRLTLDKTFTELKLYLNDIFINKSKVYDQKYYHLLYSIQKYEKIESLNSSQKNKKQSITSTADYSHTKQQKLFEQIDEITELLQIFVRKIQTRINLIKRVYKGKIYTYQKYGLLQAKVQYRLPNQFIIQRRLSVSYVANSQKPHSEAKVQLDDVLKMLRNSSNLHCLSGDPGSGKSTFLEQIRKKLQEMQKYNVLYLKRIEKAQDSKKFVGDKFFERKKNIILIDNLCEQKEIKLLVKLVKSISGENQDKYDVSYLCVVQSKETFEALTLKLNSYINKNISREQKFIHFELDLLSQEDIKYYISKAVDFKNVTQKNQLSQKIIKSIEQTSALRNPLYLNLYCQIIEPNKLDDFIQEYNPNKICKWSIMKMTFDKCKQTEQNETTAMGIDRTTSRDVYLELRQLVMKFHLIDRSPQAYVINKRTQNDKYLGKDEITFRLQQHKLELLQQLFNHCEEGNDRLIKSQLQFYPVDLKYLVGIKTQKLHVFDNKESKEQLNKRPQNNEQMVTRIKLQEFFIQSQFYQFLLVEAFAYYLSKGFKNLNVSDIILKSHLLNLTKEKAQQELSFTQLLLQLVYDTQAYPSLGQQGSNAMTLLCELNYSFSELTFDHCQLQSADMSFSTFYNCSFRDTNLKNSTLYKTSFLNCAIDSTQMDSINLFIKKYDIQYTPLCCSLSKDNKQIALGCGNYLIIIATDSGKQIKKIQAHLDVIRSVKFSNDGNYLITIADDKTLRSWDLHSFKSVVFKLPQKGGTIFFSNQSQTIATIVNKNDLKVWNIKSMANQGLFQGHSDQITSVSFSTNGQYVLTGSKDTTIRLWNLKGKQLHIYKGHEKQIICAKISPTNAIIASSSKQKQLVLFQTLTEIVVGKKQFENQIIEICLDFNQVFICCSFLNDQNITILNFTSLDVAHKLEGHRQKIISISFDSYFEKLVSLSKDRTVRLWDFQNIMQKELPKRSLYQYQKTAVGPVLSISYSKKLNQYATGHSNGEINIWNDQNNRILHKLVNHEGFVSKLSFDSTGKLYSGGKDGALRIWNIEKLDDKKKDPYKKIQLFSVEMLQLKINQKNRIIVMSSANSELVVYDFTGIKLILSTRDQGKINAIAFDERDKYMAVGGFDKYVVTYKIQNQGNSLQRSEQLGEHPQIITGLAYQGDSLLISVLKNGHIYIWNYMRASLIKKIQNISPITCLSIYNKKFGCLASEDGKIRIIDLDQGKQVKVFKYQEPCLQFVTRNASQAGDNLQSMVPLIYAACKDGNIIKWNLQSLSKATNKSNNLLPLLSQQKKPSKFARKAVNQDGTLMIQIQGDKTIKLKNLQHHTEELFIVDKCPSTIEGVEFLQSSVKIYQEDKTLNELVNVVLLLKSGQFWSMKKNSIYEQFNSKNSSESWLDPCGMQGDLFYIKDKKQVFFKSGIKKLSKQIRKPTQLVIEQVTIGS